MSAHDLVKTMIREVLYTTGITATGGIGTNLYLAKLAMDITAKHALPMQMVCVLLNWMKILSATCSGITNHSPTSG